MKKFLFLAVLVLFSVAHGADTDGTSSTPEVPNFTAPVECIEVTGGQEGTGSNKIEEGGTGQRPEQAGCLIDTYEQWLELHRK